MRNRISLVVSAMLVVGLVAGLTTSAFAGAGDPGATAAKKKKKACPAGTHKVTIKKKNGKKKKKCVADTPATTGPTGTATLTISPTSFTYPDTQHGDQSTPQAFTVTNTGIAASGVPSASITEVHNPEIGGPPGYGISANTCTAALGPGGTCTLSVIFEPNSNAGDETYTSVLHVIASPGGDVPAQLTGMSN